MFMATGADIGLRCRKGGGVSRGASSLAEEQT